MKGKKGKGLYLYIAMVCLVGIIAIFIVDGYLGIYDTLNITVQESEREIGPDYWQDTWAGDRGYHIRGEWGEPIFFRYEIDNRGFSAYAPNIEVTIWKSSELIAELLNENIDVGAFDKISRDWTLSPEILVEAGYEPKGYDTDQYSIKIKHGNVERKIIVEFHSTDMPGYPGQVPSPLPR